MDFSRVVGIVGNRDWPPRVDLSVTGMIIAAALSGLKEKFHFVSILRRCIMPDHVHFVIFIRESTGTHLGNIIRELKKDCSQAWEALGHEAEVKFFIPDYHDTFLSGNDQLKRMLNYVSDNPRRHLLRVINPSWFMRFRITDGKDTFEAYGNWSLIEEPQLESVMISRSFTREELVRRKRLWFQTILNDGILVSPFISVAEKRVRDWAIDNGGAIIYLTSELFTERYKPVGRLYDICSEGRLLIVSVSSDETPNGLLKSSQSLTRSACLQLNSVADRIASGSFRPLL